MKNKIIFFNLFLAIISLIIGFFIGVNYQKTRRSFIFNQTGQFNSQNRQMFNQTTRPISGEIIKKENDSLTIKLRDGSTKLVFLTDKTNISKSTKGDISDLKENENIFVFGVQNNDGSITAENIQLGQFGLRMRN